MKGTFLVKCGKKWGCEMKVRATMEQPKNCDRCPFNRYLCERRKCSLSNKELEVDQGHLGIPYWCELEETYSTPAINTIPIEWIKEQIENPPYSHSWELGEEWKAEYTTCLMVLLEDWEKENE